MNKIIGNRGEDIIEELYKKCNYKILHRNFSIKQGEIDIIAFKDNTVIIIEVKSRSSTYYGRPCQSVVAKKRAKIKYVANYYVLKYNLHRYNLRFDIAEVIFDSSYSSYKTSIISNAFQ